MLNKTASKMLSPLMINSLWKDFFSEVSIDVEICSVNVVVTVIVVLFVVAGFWLAFRRWETRFRDFLVGTVV